MKNRIYFKIKIYTCFKIIITLFVIYDNISSNRALLLYLEKGDICQKGEENYPDYICKLPENCSTIENDIKQNKFPLICTFIGNKPVVCCSPDINNITLTQSSSSNKPVMGSYSAEEMCRQYSELINTNVRNPLFEKISMTPAKVKLNKTLNCYHDMTLQRITGGNMAMAMEFPHMALLGYGNRKNEEKKWGCGGSLISNKWILSAAHCAINFGQTVSWARLGDLNIYSTTDDAAPKDYEIVEHKLHPNYHRSYVYNDIALFRLGTEVKFSDYVRPICLNTEQQSSFKTASAIGWGRIKANGPISPDLLKVNVKPIPNDPCKYSYPPSLYSRINLGILEDSMICAGDFEDGNDTCTGDSGGPLQILHVNYSCMYTQIGITSFGKYCGSKDTPGIYTRVSNYIQWIEQIVWPKY